MNKQCTTVDYYLQSNTFISSQLEGFCTTFFLAILISICSSYQIIPIVKHDQEVKFDGSYFYNYETGNGITQKAIGSRDNVKGAYSYTSPEGELIEISYVADQNGFQPYGLYIPKIPESVIRALEYIRTHPPYYKEDPYKKKTKKYE